jgi:hypothetical protein
MTVTFFDRQDESNPNNAKQIDNSDQLLKLLTSLRNRAPFFVELLGENGYALLVGIGPVTGRIQYSPGNGTLPYLMAVGDSAIQNPSTKDQDYVEFLTSDAPTPVSKRYCLPFDVVQQGAAYFLETGNRIPTLMWEET